MSSSNNVPVSMMESIAPSVTEWVKAVATLTRADRVHWCDGSVEEKQRLEEQMIERGEMTRLNADTFPDCVLYRSHPQDVARTEHLTFI
ncbi:MAG TPA: hypothetical protein VHL14_12200, partial [Steroidobacteraceae bacterium]|nr:hypothetical protein [Steroidobacteraceae bacterium]